MRTSWLPSCFFAVLATASAAGAQDRPDLLRSHGDIERAVLVNVSAAALRGSGLTVLTDPEPAVHVFSDGLDAEWGADGGGPAELAAPVSVAWDGSTVIVLDQQQRKLVAYDNAGTFLWSRTLGNSWASRVHVAGNDTLLALFVPMSEERAIVRVRGDLRDTLYAYERSSNRVRLVAPDAPGLTVTRPYTPVTQWAFLADGGLAVWEPGASEIAVRDRSGEVIERWPVPGDTHPLVDADREHWIATAIPTEFMGQHPFEPLREVARREMEFPDELPPVLEMLGDDRAGAWVRKTTSGVGEVWFYVDASGVRGALQLPAGRHLLAAGASALAVHAADELGVEMVELYVRPEWAN